MIEVAKDPKINLMAGSSCWQIPYEGVPKSVDFIQTFRRKYLSARQDLMDEKTDFNIYLPGGFGTNLEAALTFVKRSLTINANQAQTFIGNYWDPFIAWINHIVDHDKGRRDVLKWVYHIKSDKPLGQELFNDIYLKTMNILQQHYQVTSMRMQIST